MAYFEGGNADVEPLHDMGLTAADLDEVLELVAWGDKASLEVKAAVGHLYEARLAEEEKAGLAIPLVVVKEERKRGRRRLFVILAVIGALLVALMVWTRHP